jgi:hypothetical protein
MGKGSRSPETRFFQVEETLWREGGGNAHSQEFSGER